MPTTTLSNEEILAEGATLLPAKEALSLLDLGVDLDLALDLAAPIAHYRAHASKHSRDGGCPATEFDDDAGAAAAGAEHDDFAPVKWILKPDNRLIDSAGFLPLLLLD